MKTAALIARTPTGTVARRVGQMRWEVSPTLTVQDIKAW